MSQTLIYNYIEADLAKYLEIVKFGSSNEVKDAKKNIEYFYHNFARDNYPKNKQAFKLFLEEIKHFDEIIDADHQAYFIHVLKWAFWAIGDEYFDTWVEFTLKVIEHPSGKVRQAILSASDILLIGIDLPGHSYSRTEDLSEKVKRQKQLVDLVKFGLYAYSVEQLLQKYYQPKYKRYKYVSSMPVGYYKSIQILMTQNILRAEHWNHCFQWYLQFFEGRTQRIFSGNYSSDLKLLLNLIDDEDLFIIDLIIKSKK